jgi:glycosyltransferase involved in cell wall biosynthesis
MMNNKHPYRATIDPMSATEPRPLWSVMIPTYNCASYLRETLTSVLAQDPGPEVMQLEVIDDHSTLDDPEAVVKELGQGRVHFYRQPENVGFIRNFETCLQRSRGSLVHLLHGDDCVRAGFYAKLQQAFEEHPEIGAAYCRHIIMDEMGHWQRISPLEQTKSGLLSNCLERLVVRHPIQTPSIVVRREVYEALGGFDRRIACSGEDWEMWVRIALCYPFWYEVEPLACYRTHLASLSGRALRTGQNLRDIRQAYEMMRPHLPEGSAKELSRRAKDFWAFCGLHNAVQMLASGDLTGTMAQMKEALKLSHSLKVMVASTFYLAAAAEKYLTGKPAVADMFLASKKSSQSETELLKENSPDTVPVY